MGRQKFKTLQKLEESKEIKRKFNHSGAGFWASATKSSRLSNVDLWIIKVTNLKTGKSATTTCSKKNIEHSFGHLSHRLSLF